ncbi:hypothetical protein LTR10_015976 [Elasticomyces elasticus]|uniref:Uncharacterized protein n=1 Tax=Exophiala sideris TaxID=1016849 RepID=A0ABR0J257_9EURO|nr:hypothetical protein LTR10_015976 [Elasticomyces elasticus]KAK5024686.1 hypothetical protein LTS07_008532 [Exophiala sideris]KAK5030779.1 hypothetical protein LTR13_008133 [Exophiala sideris]KAK5054320.1 hypothetical protein LTR69_008935 [Exophiala sideris]KAK5179722.1 hypothetical protein LTR44_007890 [Eurotiomycetes sp. CCFEE 6388]
MRALWYDVFKDGKSIKDAPQDMLAEENDLAWRSNVETMNTRFFTVIQEDNEEVAGAVVHLTDIKDYDSLVDFMGKVPWIVHDFAAGGVFPFTNFVSVQKLFHQNNKYQGIELIKRLKPFTSSPTITWYVVLSAKKESQSGYDKSYGLDDALQSFRLLKGDIAEEVFDLQEPEQGKFLRIKANDRPEIQHYVNEFASVREGVVNVLILRAKSTCVWDFSFF